MTDGNWPYGHPDGTAADHAIHAARDNRDRLDVIEQVLVAQFDILIYLVEYAGGPMPKDLLVRAQAMEVLIEEMRGRRK